MIKLTEEEAWKLLNGNVVHDGVELHAPTKHKIFKFWKQKGYIKERDYLREARKLHQRAVALNHTIDGFEKCSLYEQSIGEFYKAIEQLKERKNDK